MIHIHGARATAEERASIAQSPAVFGPLCYQHVALLNSAELAGESVVDAAAQRRTLGGAITHWLNGSGFSAAVDHPAQPTSQCP